MLKKIILTMIAFSLSAAAFAISSDPMEIGVGARPLGMGKAFVALSDNFFMNPAGISDIDGINITSMSGKLLSDVNYVMVGISNPFAFGSLGIGYVGQGIGSIPLTRAVGTTFEVYDSTAYTNDVLLVSYALPLDRVAFIPRSELVDHLSFGTNLKYYAQGFSNQTGSLEGASGSGMDLDLALSYRPNAPFALGLNLENALPASLGGKFAWQKNSVEEGIPAVLKLGVALQVLGANGLRQFRQQELFLTLDLDNYISQTKPSVWHAGVEWWPVHSLALRLGIDQQSSDVQVNSDLTAGIGVKFRSFVFDYAYHEYSGIAENTTHYFSLGYKIGPYPEALSARVVRAPQKTFVDVPHDYWAKDPIERLASLGIISGYPDDTFRPDRTLSRAELCTLLIKAKGISVDKPGQDPFPDLPAAHWAAPYVAAAVDLKLAGGYPDGTFMPKRPLSRAEAVKILASFDELKTVSVKSDPFPDLSINHWAAPFIQAAGSAGHLEYLKGRDFEPNRAFTRAEAAEILSRTSFVRSRQ